MLLQLAKRAGTGIGHALAWLCVASQHERVDGGDRGHGLSPSRPRARSTLIKVVTVQPAPASRLRSARGLMPASFGQHLLGYVAIQSKVPQPSQVGLLILPWSDLP
jgi:hypothetical protein